MTGRESVWTIFAGFFGGVIVIAFVVGMVIWIDEKKQARVAACRTELNLPAIGSFVQMKVDGRRVQVVKSKVWHNCGHNIYVRVALHGIAHDGGNWSTARPEVYPLIAVKRFEIDLLPVGGE